MEICKTISSCRASYTALMLDILRVERELSEDTIKSYRTVITPSILVPQTPRHALLIVVIVALVRRISWTLVLLRYAGRRILTSC